MALVTMGTLTVVNVLATTAKFMTSTWARLERIERISKEERAFATAYNKAVRSYSAEVENIGMKFRAMMEYGDKSAMSALLGSSDGQMSFKRLVDALDTADIILEKIERATEALIAEIERSGNLGSLGIIPLLFTAERDHRRAQNVAEDAAARIEERREDVVKWFGQFSSLLEAFRRAPSTNPRPLPFPVAAAHSDGAIIVTASTGSLRHVSSWPSHLQSPAGDTHRNHLRTSSAIQLSFYDTPFSVNIEPAVANDVFKTITTSTPDGYSVAIKAMADRWVDDSLNDHGVPSLAGAQTSVIRKLQGVVGTELAIGASESTNSDMPTAEALRYAHLAELSSTIEKAVLREDNQKFSIAFCGMVKAGKSLFLNALMGSMILPSDELPSTAWPCRVRHVRGQTLPRLKVDAPYFQRAIIRLRMRKYGALMKDYRPPTDNDLFSALLDDDMSEETEEQEHGVNSLTEINQMREIYLKWVDLHPETKRNLLRFEESSFLIADSASGREHIVDLLAQINDVVRLCQRFNVPLSSTKNTWFPLLEVDFEALHGESTEGTFEFIDLPGVGEYDSNLHSFEDLVRLVASEVNAVVPIVSFKEVSKDDWRQQLPDIVQSAIGRPPELVLCTHLDQVVRDRVEEQAASVAKTFWPKSNDANHRVIGCSSKMGFSARSVLQLSRNSKPNFRDIWAKGSVEYDCAEKVLGTHNPEATFNDLTYDTWLCAVTNQLIRSRLPTAIKRLVTDMVLTSHQRALIEEGTQLQSQLHKAISHQHRVLLKMYRSAEEREEAYSRFTLAKAQYQQVLDEWESSTASKQVSSISKFQNGFKALEAQGLASVRSIIDAAEKHHRARYEAETADGDLVFPDVVTAEVFLQHVQNDLSRALSLLKRKFVNFVRELANRSRAEHFASLKTRIQGFLAEDAPALKEEIIAELSERGAGVESLAISSMRRKAMQSIVMRHNATSAYRSIQELIAKPLLKLRPFDFFQERLVGIDQVESEADDDERPQGIEDLGFMLRAPIAVLATVPWLFGSVVWPFLKYSEKFVLKRDMLVSELKERIISPFFDALREESRQTLDKMMTTSSELARSAVQDALANEEEHFASERLQHGGQTPEAIARAVNLMLNLHAAEAALGRLQEYLRGLSL
ncbi:hypothetical protein HYDPIDRAFT_43073 [Hydnomerulius pinastri MD-312]|uniref:Dynamin N-terminal domain-containing protein n=1 Tax=Hydnomerulius pinastri MD-312 TaxID=994086 RepID=A0A0C9WB39_9AGAM|nr:hypothetical protein HYDPIDRAFT_43073 [Hydnomerulius pinastri MD-312]